MISKLIQKNYGRRNKKFGVSTNTFVSHTIIELSKRFLNFVHTFRTINLIAWFIKVSHKNFYKCIKNSHIDPESYLLGTYYSRKYDRYEVRSTRM